MPQWETRAIIPAQFGCSKPCDMLLADIKTLFRKELQYLYPLEEIDAFFYRLIEHYLGLQRFILVMRPELTITQEEEQPLFESLAALKLEKPIQYIIGEAHFMGLPIRVNEHVLIPRPETEELVRWIIDYGQNRLGDGIDILDIGTGSGCIAIALAKAFPSSRIQALDISHKALAVARQNANQNDVNIEFSATDILNMNSDCQAEQDRRLDIIVSNPPYVRELERNEISNNVKKYEPSEALFVPNENPLVFYEAIARYAQQHLKPRGLLFLEINQYLWQETQSLFEKHNFNEIEVRKDHFGNHRMLKAIYT